MAKTLRHRALAMLALLGAPLAARAQTPRIGQPAPDFSLETLDGGRLSLSELKGHPVLVNFWASWCKPCRTEMPEIVGAYQQRLGTGLEVVAVNLTDQEKKKDVGRFVEELQMQVRVLLDVKGKVRERYRLVGLPTSIFIDRAGIVRVIHPGPMSREALDRGLAEILPGP
jgi:cytochrome c biogenesis protein CcmG, thiol:disulfide interchange protein DsbE